MPVVSAFTAIRPPQPRPRALNATRPVPVDSFQRLRPRFGALQRFDSNKSTHGQFIKGHLYYSTAMIGIPGNHVSGALFNSILRYYDEIDGNDVDAALSRLTPDAVYVRVGAQQLEGKKKILNGAKEIRTFYDTVRTLTGEHLIKTDVKEGVDVIAALGGSPEMWVSGSFAKMEAEPALQETVDAIAEDWKILKKMPGRIAYWVSVRGVHRSQTGPLSQVGQDERLVPFLDIWGFQLDEKACYRKSVLGEPFIRELPPPRKAPLPWIIQHLLDTMGYEIIDDVSFDDDAPPAQPTQPEGA